MLIRSHKGSLFFIIVIVVMIAIFISGCTGEFKHVGNADDANFEQTHPVEMKIVLGYAEAIPSKDNLVIQELSKLANANIMVEWTPMVSYNDKFNVLMSSNNMPDVIVVPDVKNSTFVFGVNAGLFWELTPILQEYSHLSKINPVLLKNTAVNGKFYMLPRERTLKRKMIVYRSDWAKKAGLEAPDSIDGIYDMAKAFAEGDFDQNSQKDTIGFALGTVNNEIDCLDALVVALGGFNRWGIKDEKIIPSFMTDEYLKTLKWLRRMFQENLLSPDFAITKTTQIVPDIVNEEKTGLWLSYKLPGLSDPVLVDKQKEDPSIKREDVYEFAFLKGPDNTERIAAETGVSGGFAFPTTSVTTKERLIDLLNVFNVIQSQQGQILINNGVPDLHFELVDGKYAKPKDPEVFNTEVSPIGQLGTSGMKSYIIAGDDISIRLDLARRTFDSDGMIFDITAPLSSNSYSSNYATLLNIISEAQFKFIMGDIDEKGWERAIEGWKNAGGNAAIKEFTRAYYNQAD
ncbi:MAG TPA: hypothetical protein VFD00_02465 [Thermoclostridium sp.]|nr:hypothetical protein [Thermoclostridium sp.]